MPKNKNDVRFVRAENRLMGAFYALVKKRRGTIGIKSGEVSKNAGLAASTLYRHHRSLAKMVIYNEHKTIGQYRRLLARLEKHGASLKDLAASTLEFLEKHREFFEVVAKIEYVGAFEDMGEALWKVASKSGSDYGPAMKEIKQVYSYEVAAILMRWTKQGMPKTERNNCAGDLAKLSKNAARRLNFLV